MEFNRMQCLLAHILYQICIKKRQKAAVLHVWTPDYGKLALARSLLYWEHRKVYFDNTEGQLKDIGTNKGRYKLSGSGRNRRRINRLISLVWLHVFGEMVGLLGGNLRVWARRLYRPFPRSFTVSRVLVFENRNRNASVSNFIGWTFSTTISQSFFWASEIDFLSNTGISYL